MELVDNATKRQLRKPDQFVATTEHGLEWVSENRGTAILWGAIAVVAILVAVGLYTLYQHRTAQASTALGAAMQTYQTPLASAAEPVPPGIKTFPDAKTRAAEANRQFLAVADQYGLTEPGRVARYFAGVTYIEEGNTAAARQVLEKVADGWNSDLAALGKLALAQLDAQGGDTAQAVKLYNELSKGHASTVPPGLAQIELAEMYQAQGRQEEARKILAEVKDKDKGPKGQLGPAGELASQKLNPQPAGAPAGLQ